MKNFTYWLSVIVIGLALGLFVQFVQAWVEPSASPPGGSLGAPLNTGALTQIKAGTLGINSNGNPVGLVVNGNVGIGTADPEAKLDVKGKAKADDFCLQDNSKCLSNISSAADNSFYFPESRRVHVFNSGGFCNDTWRRVVINLKGLVPENAKKALVKMRCTAARGNAVPIGSYFDSSNSSIQDDERIRSCQGGNNINDTNFIPVTLSSDKQFVIWYRSWGCTSSMQATLLGYTF